jgi:hypothetical protein
VFVQYRDRQLTRTGIRPCLSNGVLEPLGKTLSVLTLGSEPVCLNVGATQVARSFAVEQAGDAALGGFEWFVFAHVPAPCVAGSGGIRYEGRSPLSRVVSGASDSPAKVSSGASARFAMSSRK